jgi:hypothetical protein
VRGAEKPTWSFSFSAWGAMEATTDALAERTVDATEPALEDTVLRQDDMIRSELGSSPFLPPFPRLILPPPSRPLLLPLPAPDGDQQFQLQRPRTYNPQPQTPLPPPPPRSPPPAPARPNTIPVPHRSGRSPDPPPAIRQLS